jgi:hypothetical protein
MSHVWDYDYRQKISAPLFRVVIEVFFFSLIGVIFGFAVTLLMPPFTLEEPWYYSLVYLFLELIVDAVVIYTLMTAYFMLFGVDADSYIGISVFSNVFFMIQYSLAHRMQNIFTTYTQVELKNNMPIVHPKKRQPAPETPTPQQLLDYEYVTA